MGGISFSRGVSSLRTQVEDNNSIENGKAIVSLKYWSKCGEELQKHIAMVRKYMAATGLDCGNMRCIPESMKEKHVSIMSEFEDRYIELRRAFLDRYDANIYDERQLLGSAFDEKVYPSYNKMCEKLSFTSICQEVSATEINGIRMNMDTAFQGSVYKEFIDMLDDCVKTLNENKRIVEGEHKKGCFGKLIEFCNKIPSLNVLNDGELNAKANNLITVMASFDIDMLREEGPIKSSVKNMLSAASETFARRM
jgi:hypothetical protein